ncbi:MAG: hypothetical protein CMM50_12840 [Rhodospirillaceae bacterium]|nr:hypothetical protein [Rhodospirillaceae bacterium]
METSRDRILTTHTGSLPRPPELVELYTRRVAGEAVDEAVLAAAASEAVRDVVRRQHAAGIDIANNGEQPREAFFLYVRRRMSGFGETGGRKPFADIAAYPDFAALRAAQYGTRRAVSNTAPPAVIGPIRYLDPDAILAECAEFREALTSVEPFTETFLTAPSPGIIAAAVPNRYYMTEEGYLGALAEALAVEYRAIVEQGFLLQIDAPDLALERHVSYADRSTADFVGFVERVVAAINGALVGIPRDSVRLHVCWGNYEGPHDCDVPLADILAAVAEADVGAIVLPFANPRHEHEYPLLADPRLADDRVLIPGVIDTTTNFVEHPEAVAGRIERIARAVGDPTRIIAATDCGFDTSAGMSAVASSVAWAKLKSLSEGARIASERLFGG